MQKTNSSKVKTLYKEHKLLIILFVFILIFTFFPYDWLNGLHIGKCHLVIKDYNNLGDFIGGIVGTVVSGFACYLVYLTYKSQKEELKVQREVMQQQRFETTFFNLLDSFVKTSNSFTIKDKKENLLSEKNFFSGFINLLRDFCFKNNVDRDSICKCYITECEKYPLTHYFNSLLNLLMFIEEYSQEYNLNPILYKNFITAQMTQEELEFIYLECSFSNYHLQLACTYLHMFDDIESTIKKNPFKINLYQEDMFGTTNFDGATFEHVRELYNVGNVKF